MPVRRRGRQTAATGASSAVNPLRYTQGLLDEQTDWIKHGVRYHDTTTANWTAQDQLSQLLRAPRPVLLERPPVATAVSWPAPPFQLPETSVAPSAEQPQEALSDHLSIALLRFAQFVGLLPVAPGRLPSLMSAGWSQ
ncbi:hypothetical protein ACIA49_27270 [Kribbella sp. NPDC051587]|uniref:hypothetical protein n=1 Tax=Kribbella sp. NPDC051587 TaxID=3364119 RepID=UPI00378B97BB